MDFRRNITIFMFILSLLSCQTVQEGVVLSSNNIKTPGSTENKNTSVIFDPKTISEEKKLETMSDIKAFIDKLNQIIRNQKYDQWLSYLTPEYRDYWSNLEKLTTESERNFLKSRGIKLKRLKYYFIYVVYPAKQNSSVDDIDFIDQNKVVVYAVIKKERAVLYYLEKHGDQWLIGLGR